MIEKTTKITSMNKLMYTRSGISRLIEMTSPMMERNQKIPIPASNRQSFCRRVTISISTLPILVFTDLICSNGPSYVSTFSSSVTGIGVSVRAVYGEDSSSSIFSVFTASLFKNSKSFSSKWSCKYKNNKLSMIKFIEVPMKYLVRNFCPVQYRVAYAMLYC